MIVKFTGPSQTGRTLQAGVISTHSVLYFAPAAASLGSGAALLLLHVSREGFFFVSSCMLTYAYSGLNRAQLRRFYWRRFLSAGIPYLCWSAVYFLYHLPASHYASVTAGLRGLAGMVATGYYQLYFLLVIMQFSLVFPLVLLLLRRTGNHHGLVVAVAALAQVALTIAMHWNLLPAVMIKSRAAGRAQLRALPGRRLRRRLPPGPGTRVGVRARTADRGARGEGVYFLAANGVTTVLGSGNDPFQPSVSPGAPGCPGGGPGPCRCSPPR
jgi:hypothetical protein